MIKKEQDLEIVDLEQRQAYFCCNKNHPLIGQEALDMKDILGFPIAVMWLPGSIIDMLSRATNVDHTDITDLPNGVVKCDNFSILHAILHLIDAVGMSIDELIQNSQYSEQLTHLTIVKLQNLL